MARLARAVGADGQNVVAMAEIFAVPCERLRMHELFEGIDLGAGQLGASSDQRIEAIDEHFPIVRFAESFLCLVQFSKRARLAPGAGHFGKLQRVAKPFYRDSSRMGTIGEVDTGRMVHSGAHRFGSTPHLMS